MFCNLAYLRYIYSFTVVLKIKFYSIILPAVSFYDHSDTYKNVYVLHSLFLRMLILGCLFRTCINSTQCCGTKVISGLLYITVFFTCNVANFDNFNDFAYFAYFDTILMNKIISGRTYVNGYINNIYNSGHSIVTVFVW
jgi:hypothetical protein